MNELELFEKKMTIKELSDLLLVSEKHIRVTINKCYPKLLKNGVKTYLTEEQCTRIKLEIGKNPHLDQSVELPKTSLEKKLLIQQAMNFLNEEVEQLKQELVIKETLLLEQAPKVELADKCLRDTNKHYSIRDAGKHLGLSQTQIFAILRDNGLLTKSNLPSQKALNYKVLELRTNTDNLRNYPQAIMTMENINNFKARYIWG